MDSSDLLRAVFVLIPMILSLTVHEFSHAWMAFRLGDDTAARMGRLTLNPVAHIDPIGTLLIPMVGLVSGVPFFGWAKPVPVSPVNYTRKLRMRTADILVSAAGPVSNLLFAAVMVGLLAVVGQAALPDIVAGTRNLHVAAVRLMGWTLVINLGLFVFNLIPVPPLDGSHVLAGLLPDRHRGVMEFISRYSFVLFILILFLGGRYIGAAVEWLMSGFSALVGFDLWLTLMGA
ncbi:MAG TPA: site-2 protease family protein [Myxococcota bacterium]|nr:site-2 protease family protein [Myxococcota bacterium]HRY96116.1 site-2 protease family protein [Myxococcota bacterium]HSA24179.1 site-2 protease family protein [Myxococcota bacterium]